MGRLENEQNSSRIKRATEQSISKNENNQEYSELQSEYTAKLRVEIEKIEGLEVYIKHHTEEHTTNYDKSTEQIKKEISALKEYSDVVLAQKKSKVDELKSEIKSHANKFEASLKEIEEDVDTEIIEISTHYEKKIREEKLSTKTIHVENKQIRNDVEALGSKLTAEKVKLNKSTQEEKMQQMIMVGFQKDIESVHREVIFLYKIINISLVKEMKE